MTKELQELIDAARAWCKFRVFSDPESARVHEAVLAYDAATRTRGAIRGVCTGGFDITLGDDPAFPIELRAVAQSPARLIPAEARIMAKTLADLADQAEAAKSKPEEEKSCGSCMYQHTASSLHPCWGCRLHYTQMSDALLWQPKPKPASVLVEVRNELRDIEARLHHFKETLDAAKRKLGEARDA